MARARRTSAVLVALVAGLGLAGCSVTNPMTTSWSYAASDGVRVELSDMVVVENLFVLTAAEGEPGTVLGAVVNRGGQDVEVSIGLPDGTSSQAFTVPAGLSQRLGPDDEAIDIDAVPAAPGALVELAVISDRSGSTTLRVPVLDGTLPEYTDLVP
ncbi:hypothetical protein [Actinotalea sp. K2]|uniref:hypothetical protein n=1 Tax=Actinotalea sp. K2 TaxID=2939438 RepID=UPI0020174097|nr:hypothetical protein [Actinotalea sp. K2]MCL3861488.1 hypothetical protein [Actinotalea sp. K2]